MTSARAKYNWQGAVKGKAASGHGKDVLIVVCLYGTAAKW